LRIVAIVAEVLVALAGVMAFYAMGASWTTVLVIALCAAAGTAVLGTGLFHRER
jgi:hypothetical protein